MADRTNPEQGTQRDQNPERQHAAAADRSSGQQQSGGSAQTAVRTDRERGVQTSRETGRPRRGTTGLQQRGGNVAPYTGQVATPFALVRRMMEDMDRMFENVGIGRGFGVSPWRALDELDELSGLPAMRQGAGIWAPPLEVFERGNELVVRADLPGLSKDDVNVEVENGVLTISGERRAENEEEREGFYRSERSYGTFARSVGLPEGVNEEQCNATFKDGVLEVTMPKPKEDQPRRRIDIK